MKTITTLLFVFFIGIGFAQEPSDEEIEQTMNNLREHFKVKEKDGNLIILDSIELKKGDKIMINKPFMKDFSYIKRDAQGMKMLNKVADYAGVAGVATGVVGWYAKDLGTLRTSSEILNHSHQARNVVWTSSEINRLNASKKAKKIIGEDFIVEEWNIDSDALGAYLKGTINNKRYKIQVVLATMAGEILFY